MSALLRDIFTIPETTSTSDYVLRLTESVDDAHLARTLADYVVTPEIARSFDAALGAVAQAIRDNKSQGRFLTGSFGSGKSHFMAVLHALLRQDPRARAIPELATPIARHDPELQDRRVLPLTFHLLGAKSLEQALFDGYLRQIGELHPDSNPPILHQTDQLLANAESMRAKMGDEQFFAGMNEGSGGGDVWGAVLGEGGTWDATSYSAARAASADDQRRIDLVAALKKHWFPSFQGQATHIGLDEGLTAISAHAASLGYDAVVLFLDELVLWLAFQIRNQAFFGAEAQKITKLVEGGQGGRRIPFVSFIARQMDLRRWLADSGASGSEQTALEQAFQFQEGRFPQIRLGDDNLPWVAHKRLLAPQDADAEAEIRRAFDALDRRSEAWDVLLDGINTDDRHRGADEQQFRLTYPFSPALMSTLRSLASVMQRERTALKVMQQILVDRRDDLTIDDVVPVGDAFDYLVTGAAGDQPLDEAAAALFRSANDLYRNRLLPAILSNHNLTRDDVEAGLVTPGLQADLRLAKTLLLSAVAPNVPALKSLTASRLASLNHGSIRTPLPGGEAHMVLSKVRNWATTIPEIRVENSSQNPLIQVQLADVEYETVVERARGEDNEGRRRELIKRLVSESLGLQLGDQDMMGVHHHKVVWRGSPRVVELVFGNVRDSSWLSDQHFRANPDAWRFVIDHPFDDSGHSAAEDQRRIDDMRARNWDEQTIVWLPRFFSETRMRDVSRLVILNFLLEGSGDRYDTYADHLSEPQRQLAKALLLAQRDALLHQLRQAVQVAYDVESSSGGEHVVPDSHPDVLSSLTPSFTPRPPAGGTLRQAFDGLVDDAFAATYPGHPDFQPSDTEVRARDLQVVYDYVERALGDPENRISLGPEASVLRRLANPLGVGRAAETHFLMGDSYFGTWGPEFERRMGARDDDGPVTVRDVRQWIAGMEPRLGLTTDVSDLVILAWAALRRRAWFAHGGAIPTPRVGQLRPEMELREQELPDPQTWATATALAASLFGIHAPAYMTPTGVANLADEVHNRAVALTDGAHRLVGALEQARTRLSLGPAPHQGRLATARSTVDLVDALRGLKGLAVINRLAASTIAEPLRASRSLDSADAVARGLSSYTWERLDPLVNAARQEGPRADEASRILARLKQAVEADEFAEPLSPALKHAEDRVFAWLANVDTTTVAPDPTPTVGPKKSGRTRLRGGQGIEGVTRDLADFAADNPGVDIVVEWRVE